MVRRPAENDSLPANAEGGEEPVPKIVIEKYDKCIINTARHNVDGN
jgi:hypothetical protein